MLICFLSNGSLDAQRSFLVLASHCTFPAVTGVVTVSSVSAAWWHITAAVWTWADLFDRLSDAVEHASCILICLGDSTIPLRGSSTSLDADSDILLRGLILLSYANLAYSLDFFLLFSLTASAREDSSCLDLHTNQMKASVCIGT